MLATPHEWSSGRPEHVRSDTEVSEQHINRTNRLHHSFQSVSGMPLAEGRRHWELNSSWNYIVIYAQSNSIDKPPP